MGFIAASMVLCLLALLAGSDGPHGTVPVAMTWIAVAGGVAGVLLWMWRWTTRSQSVAFGLTCTAAVALACLAHPNPLAALIGCVAFASFGAYLAFFHTTALVLYNFAVAAAVGSWEALALARSGHSSLAESLAAQVCCAIADSAAGVTASIGTACARLDDPRPNRKRCWGS